MRKDARVGKGLFGLVVLAMLLPGIVAAQPSAHEGHLWIAGPDGTQRVDIGSGDIDRRISTSLPVDALVADAKGGVWLLSNNTLFHYTREGEQQLAVSLPVDGSMLANMLELDIARNTIWVADPLNVFRFNLVGELQQHAPATSSMFWDADVDAQGRLWLAGYDSAWVMEAGGDVQMAFSDPGLAAYTISVDETRSGLWLVGGHGAALYSADGAQQALVAVQTLFDPVHAASDGSGGLWVAGSEAAAYIDSNNAVPVIIAPFDDITLPDGGRTYISELIADDVSGSVWMATTGAARRFSANGSITRDLSIATGGSILALACYRDRIAPEIHFDFPEDHTTSDDPRVPLGLSWSDAGEGVNTETLRIGRNGEVLEVACTLANETATCLPASDMPEGSHYLTATLADRAGNVSEPAELNLTIQPQGPRIDSFTPANGPVGTRVTLTGRGFDVLSPAGNRVTFNGASAIISRVSTTEIDVIVPLAASTGAIHIENNTGEHTAELLFTVTLRENFEIGITEPGVQLPQNGQAFTTLTLASLGLVDYAQLVDLQFEGVPPGIEISLDHARLALGRPVTLAFTGSAPPGTYTIKVLATGMVDGQLVTREIEIELVILPEGSTTLGGRILHADDDRPFVGALVQLGDEIVETDSTGSYLFVNPPLEGEQVILIDGHTNNTAEFHYASRIVMPVFIQPGEANRALTSFLSAVDTSSYTDIIPGEAINVTNPEIPGYELRIPQGATLTGWDGEFIDRINVRVIAPDRLPIRPIPEGVTTRNVYLYYFFRAGGAEPSEPIPVTMRNDLDLLPGEKADLWYYDETPTPNPDSNQWRIMGQGTVSADGLSIVSDPGVGIPRFCCGAGFPSVPDAPPAPPTCGGPKGGNPVDLATGIGSVLEDHTLGLNGLFPAEIQCGYSSNSERDGPFGIGTWMNYEWRVLGGGASYTVVSPQGARYTLVQDADGVFRARSGRTEAAGMALTREGSIARLRTKSGKVMEFSIGGSSNPFNTLLMAVEDSSGNRIRLTREASLTTANGRLLAVDDANGRRWRLDYQSARRISAITDPLGRVQHFTYDPAGRLNSVTDFEQNTLHYTWNDNNRIATKRDAAGAVTHYEYDDAGRTTGETLANNGTYRFDYNLVGETVTGTKVTNPRGFETRYRFNALGYETRRTDALGRRFEKNYDLARNLLRSETDPLGRKTFYTYDERGNRTSVRNPADHITVKDYHPIHNKPTRIQDALERETHFTYDTNGNIKTITNAENETTRFTHDERGLMTSITNPLGHTTQFTYDSEGNLTRVTDALGNSTRYEYDLANRKVAETDPLGRTTRYAYDALDRLTRLFDARGGITEITYTPTGKLESVTDAKGAVIETNTFDAMGNLKTKADSQGRTHHYEYDLNNNLTSHTDPKGQVTTYTYDELDRLTSITDADGRVTQYHHDLAGRLTHIFDTVSGQTRYEYDQLDRLTREITDRGMIEYEYDALDQLNRRVVNGSDITTYEYDAAGRMTRTMHTNGSGHTYEISVGYDAAGQLITQFSSSGVGRIFTYDEAGRLLEINYEGPEGNELDRIQYQYDEAGSIVAKNRFGGAPVSETPFVAEYDEDNRMLAFNGFTLTYDDNGNLVSRETEDGIVTYSWDSWNRLTEIDSPNGHITFKYDDWDRRIEKTVDGDTTYYLYDDYQVVAELNPQNILTTYHTGLIIDEVFGVYGGGNDREFLADILGSLIAELDLNGSLVVTNSFSPFGESAVAGTSQSDLSYTGREKDQEYLYYYRARYYDSQLKRFISVDPIGFDDGFNVYAYVGGDPINYFDGNGLEREHRSNKRKSSKGKHESGRARNARDKGGEKGDARRKPNNNKRRSVPGKRPSSPRSPGGLALPAWDILQEMCRLGVHSGIGCLPENDRSKCII